MKDKMSMLGEMLAKKDSGEMSLDPTYKKAKMGVLKDLHKHMGSLIGDDMMPEDMKKVTVAADDEQGLEEGLDKAKELLGDMPEAEEEMSEDEIMQKMEELKALLAKKKAM